MSEKNPIALVSVNMAWIETALAQGESFDVIQIELNKVATNVDLTASLMDRFEINAKYFRDEAAKYTEVAREWERAESYLKQMIKADMEAHEVADLHGTNIRFKLSNSKPTLEIDEKELDSSYIMHVPQPDKKKIEEALSLGLSVKGAKHVETKQLRTYLVKKAEK